MGEGGGGGGEGGGGGGNGGRAGVDPTPARGGGGVRPRGRLGALTRAGRGAVPGDRRAPGRRRAGPGARARLAPRRHSPRPVRPAALRAGVPSGGRVIDEKAQELGRLLGQSVEYKNLKRASERLREDAECRTKLEELERLAAERERAGASGKEPAREQVGKDDQRLQSVQGKAG